MNSARLLGKYSSIKSGKRASIFCIFYVFAPKIRMVINSLHCFGVKSQNNSRESVFMNSLMSVVKISLAF